MQDTFKGRSKLDNLVASDNYDIMVDGKSFIGIINVSSGIRLESQANQTMMH